MRKNDHTFFANTDCKYYPCHKGADFENFNCLFCYCPLYCMGENCGGNFTYTFSGQKDCADCMLPHTGDAHRYITNMLFNNYNAEEKP